MLHAVYRTTAAANTKPRPRGFSKQLCLDSFLRAYDEVPGADEPVFLVDGPVEGAPLPPGARIARIDARDVFASYWAALDLALSSWPDGDLVYLAEDDHLYRPEAFGALVAAAEALPGADYFALYATVGATMANGEPLYAGARRPYRTAESLGGGWVRATSHTSSFAVRVGALREDRRIHTVGAKVGGIWDHALCLALAGRAPFGPLGLLKPPRDVSASRKAKTLVWRLALSALALGKRRTIAAPSPALATHMEVGELALGTDWEAVASAASGYAGRRAAPAAAAAPPGSRPAPR